MAVMALQRQVLATIYALEAQLLTLFLAPYNVIHVGAAAPNVPSGLVNQLSSPGRMFIPVGVYTQNVQQVDKNENGRVTQQPILSVSVSYSSFCHPGINLRLAIYSTSLSPIAKNKVTGNWMVCIHVQFTV